MDPATGIDRVVNKTCRRFMSTEDSSYFRLFVFAGKEKASLPTINSDARNAM